MIEIFYIFILHFVAYNIYKNQCSEVYISLIKLNFKSGRNLSFFIGNKNDNKSVESSNKSITTTTNLG